MKNRRTKTSTIMGMRILLFFTSVFVMLIVGCRKDPVFIAEDNPAWDTISFYKFGNYNELYQQSSVMVNIDFLSEDKIVFGGQVDPLYSNGLLLISNDTGKSFSAVDSTYEGGNLKLFSFPDEQTGFAAYYSLSGSAFIKTTDGGLTWNSNVPPFLPNGAIHFLNDTLGFLNGYITVDGGESWISQGLSEVLDYEFVNFNVGYVINSNNELYKTSSSGSSWNVVHTFVTDSVSYATKMQFLNEEVGYIINAFGLQKTIDGGITWQTLFNDSPRAVYFKNDQIGFVTSAGKIYKTTNGGTSWQLNYETPIITFESIDGKNDVVIAVGTQLGLDQMPNRRCYYVRTSTLGE